MDDIDLSTAAGRLRWARDRAGYDAAEDFARLFGISGGTYRHYENGVNGFAKWAPVFAVKLGVDPVWLLNGKGKKPEGEPPPRDFEAEPSHVPSKFVLINEYDVEAAAGDGSLIETENVIGQMPFRADFISYRTTASPADLAVLRVDGDSMEPLLRSGDFILINRAQDRVGADGIYVFNFGGALHVKRLQMRIGQPVLVRSDNPAYEDWPAESEQLRVIGKVIWLGRSI